MDRKWAAHESTVFDEHHPLLQSDSKFSLFFISLSFFLGFTTSLLHPHLMHSRGVVFKIESNILNNLTGSIMKVTLHRAVKVTAVMKDFNWMKRRLSGRAWGNLGRGRIHAQYGGGPATPSPCRAACLAEPICKSAWRFVDHFQQF